jgi:hypothetical protein
MKPETTTIRASETIHHPHHPYHPLHKINYRLLSYRTLRSLHTATKSVSSPSSIIKVEIRQGLKPQAGITVDIEMSTMEFTCLGVFLPEISLIVQKLWKSTIIIMRSLFYRIAD